MLKESLMQVLYKSIRSTSTKPNRTKSNPITPSGGGTVSNQIYDTTPRTHISAEMWSYNNTIPIFGILLLLLSIITQTQAASPEFFDHFCTNTTTYNPNTTFQTNLNNLLTSLSSNATKNRGFYNYTAGRNSLDIAYGLSLCRGDVTPSVCQDCVSTASKEIVKKCPKDKEAIIFYDECMLRYSDRYIFATKDGSIGFPESSRKNLSNPSGFQQILRNEMDKLATRASNIERSDGNDVKGFATGSFNFSRQTIYELVQCTPDLSVADCSQCFQEIIVQLPSVCNQAQGCRYLFPSCNIRYEVYPFYNNLVARTSPSPPTATKSKGGSSSKVIVGVIIASTCSALVILVLGFCYKVRRPKRHDTILLDESFDEEIATAESLQYDLSTIRAATNNFSVDNKIGEGGFGSVFKGALANGQEIAVKKLSRKSGQGAEQFKTEVVLVAKLHHRNLVRLLGFCLQEEEKILIYEYIPNNSLDSILFDPERRQQLDWPIRYKIIVGTARGMVYLHEDSRLRIIHRDLKASNILLDENMNPKITDFGMAKIFGVDQTHGNTNRVVGTFGYMSPEYAMHGHFSLKSDVFSFGVLVLEIISGKRNNSFYQSDGAEDLLGYAWQLWKNGRPLELMDPCLANTYSRNEVIRCINIGLLCVQEDVMARPSMASVLTMLSSYSVTMSLPRRPPRYAYSRTELKTPERLRDESTSSPTSLSLNEFSITEVYPR